MDRKQHVAIFTTASVPWMTGTAVNPLFRAAYLSKDAERKVTLGIPWLTLKDQELVYPSNITFRTLSEQEGYVRQWLEERTGFKSTFDIRFYPAKVITLQNIFLLFYAESETYSNLYFAGYSTVLHGQEEHPSCWRYFGNYSG